jgi:hypothetical protein
MGIPAHDLSGMGIPADVRVAWASLPMPRQTGLPAAEPAALQTKTRLNPFLAPALVNCLTPTTMTGTCSERAGFQVDSLLWEQSPGTDPVGAGRFLPFRHSRSFLQDGFNPETGSNKFSPYRLKAFPVF